MSIFLSQNLSKIDGTTSLSILTGNQKADKLLVSDSAGRVDWAPVRGQYTGNRKIGELYGGGIVVATWNTGDDESVLIASLNDAQSYQIQTGLTFSATFWSPDQSTSTNARSLYDGMSNYSTVRSGFGFSAFGLGSAMTFRSPDTAYSDWYLPAAYEMKLVYDAAFYINRTLGNNNFKNPDNTTSYWTSTETDATTAISMNVATGRLQNSLKSSSLRMRPVRLETPSLNDELMTNLDATKQKSYNDAKLPGRWADLVNSGLTSSYSFTFSSINNTGPTYSPNFGGYMYFNGNSYIDIYSPIGDSDTVTIEMWARIKPQSANRMLFGWSSYDIYWVDGVGLGFNTGAGDLYGISNATFTGLGIVDRWVHYVFEMRSGVAYSNNKIYIDGVIQSLVQGAGTQNITNTNFNGGNGRIGCWTSSLLTGGGTPYLGVFDLSVFKIYKRALTQAEITTTFNNTRRRYEIGITGTHTIDNTTGDGSLSISQNLVLNVNGKKNAKVLRSDKNGVASWVDKNYLFDRPSGERFVGERFHGGIITSKWRYPANVLNYLIMSDRDINFVLGTVYIGNGVETRIELFLVNLLDYIKVGMSVRFTVAGITKNLSVASVDVAPGAFSTYRTRLFLNETIVSTLQTYNNVYVTIGTSGLSVQWSSITSTSVPPFFASPDAKSEYKGASNSFAILNQTGVTNSVARFADMYQADGFKTGWYIPSISEFTTSINNLVAVGYNYGTFSMPDGKYWTSTESSTSPTTRAIELTVSSQGTVLGASSSLKSNKNKMRAFKQVAVVQPKQNWNKPNPWNDPDADWITDPWSEKNWSQWTGISSNSLVFHFNPDKFNSLPTRTQTLGSSALDIAGNRAGTIRSLVNWDYSFNSVRFNGTYSTSTTTFTQNSYIVFNTPISTDLYTSTTIEAWVYPDLPVEVGVNDDERCGIVSTAGYEISLSSASAVLEYPAGFTLCMSSNDGTDTYKLKLKFADGSQNGIISFLNSTTTGRPLVRYSWNHIVVSTTSASVNSIWINGVVVATAASGIDVSGGADGGSVTINSTYKRVIVGCNNGIKKVFSGLIGQVRVYSDALTTELVRNNFENDRIRYGL